MWYFSSPEIVFGEDALDYLEELDGERAFIVTDPVLHELGFSERIAQRLKQAGLAVQVFHEVEPEPSLQTVRRGAAQMMDFAPDWIVGLGGGSSMDAAKAMWALYEQPDLAPEEISPVGDLPIRKAKLIAIPTTSGTGSEVTWMVVLTDTEQHRKLGLGHRNLKPTVALVDPALTAQLPPRITADTGMDVLTHAVEAYVAAFRSDFTDGLCLKACELVFNYLPRAVAQGAEDPEAREKMANAATIAGLAFSNSFVGLAHALGHSLGGHFRIPHGRAVGLFLPYVMEFTANGGAGRYGDIARHLRLHDGADEAAATAALVSAIRDLSRQVGQPLNLAEAGISAEDFETSLPIIVPNAMMDNSVLAAPRPADMEEYEKLYRYAFEGKNVDF